MLLDAFTPVTYVSRRQYGVKGASVRITYNPRVEHDHTLRGDTIGIGTPTVWVLALTLVEGPDDVSRAGAIQRQISVDGPMDYPAVGRDRICFSMTIPLTVTAWGTEPLI